MAEDKIVDQKIEEFKEKVGLSGIIVGDLLNPKFIEKLKEKNVNATPFIIGIDVNSESIIVINHHDTEEIGKKIIHVESRTRPESEKDKGNIDVLAQIIKELGGK